MYSHVTLGSNDIEQGRAFYDRVLGALGASRVRDMEGASIWAGPDGGTMFILLTPRDGEPASVGNGLTIGFKAPDAAAVDAFHAGGIETGGADEGAPGPRDFAPGAYAGYLRDPGGNKIMAVCFVQ